MPFCFRAATPMSILGSITQRGTKKPRASDPNDMQLDELLLGDAFDNHKPLLGICYGLQSLNVFRAGSLIQHIESPIDHTAGRKVAKAHTVRIEPESKLARIIGGSQAGGNQTVAVNSSHHQSADAAGDGLRVVARSAEDGIVEALEGTSPEHFVLAVQWHPERSVNDGPELAEPAHAIFRAFIEAAGPGARNHPEPGPHEHGPRLPALPRPCTTQTRDTRTSYA